MHTQMYSKAVGHSSVPVFGTEKELELELACKSLQKQVTELQEVLSSMSNYMFHAGAMTTLPDKGE